MRILLIVMFWIWAIAGLFLNVLRIIAAHGSYELGVGTSAAITMDIVFWIGGLLTFGLGAILTDPPPPLEPEVSVSDHAIAAVRAALE